MEHLDCREGFSPLFTPFSANSASPESAQLALCRSEWDWKGEERVGFVFHVSVVWFQGFWLAGLPTLYMTRAYPL